MEPLKIAAALCCLLSVSLGQSRLDLASYQNCEILDPQIKLAWTVNNNNSTVHFLLCGCRQEDLTERFVNQYVAFGVSGSQGGVLMQGGDVIVAWIDSKTRQANAVDYFLESYSQCREGEGVCPDTEHSSGRCTNDIISGSVEGSQEDGIQCISFEKPFTTQDSTCDLTLTPNEEQYVLWAIGGIEQTAFKHFIRTETTATPLRLGRIASNNCAGASFECPICHSFIERVFDVRNKNATFVATVGPTGGGRGYAAIAGRAGWGYSWYINGTLIPQLIVSRGYTYSFISEGGDDPSISQYHPFYLTSSVSGGRIRNNDLQRAAETVYAGYGEDGVTPLGIGPYCEYTATADSRAALNDCGTFQEFLDALSRGSCPPLTSLNHTAGFTWTPNDTTPDTLYYQCATHRGFGYKISVYPPLSSAPASFTASIFALLLMALISTTANAM